jgi:transcriptional regulator with XRE-family HTH domain
MSQRDLADQMRQRGHNWHQQTVGRIESGSQPVRFGELVDLAAVLDTTIDSFAAPTQELTEAESLYAAANAVSRAAAGVTGEVSGLLRGRDHAQAVAEQAQGSGSPRVRAARVSVLAALDYLTVEQAVADGVAMHANPGTHEKPGALPVGQLKFADAVRRGQGNS